MPLIVEYRDPSRTPGNTSKITFLPGGRMGVLMRPGDIPPIRGPHGQLLNAQNVQSTPPQHVRDIGSLCIPAEIEYQEEKGRPQVVIKQDGKVLRRCSPTNLEFPGLEVLTYQNGGYASVRVRWTSRQ